MRVGRLIKARKGGLEWRTATQRIRLGDRVSFGRKKNTSTWRWHTDEAGPLGSERRRRGRLVARADVGRKAETG